MHNIVHPIGRSVSSALSSQVVLVWLPPSGVHNSMFSLSMRKLLEASSANGTVSVAISAWAKSIA
jgi:hypothetical protein